MVGLWKKAGRTLYIYALFPGKGDVHIGAFLRVEAAAHPDVAQVRAALDDVFAHAGGIAQQRRNIFISMYMLH